MSTTKEKLSTQADQDGEKKIWLRFKGFSFVGFCHGYFSWLGNPILQLYRGIADDLKAADMRIHALAYTSLVAFFTLLSIFLSLIGVLLQIVGFLFAVPSPLVILWFSMPLLTLIIGRVIPKILAFNRAAALEIEVPYASAYVSVMSTGGLSPYRSLQRLKYVDLLPNLAKAAKRMDLEVEIMGVDPLTAIESLARTTPSREYQDLLLGYSSTLSAGGDVVHYLKIKAETIFRDRLAKVKAIGERLALLLEIYVAFSVLLALGIFMMFIVSRILPSNIALPAAFGAGQFVMFGYIFLPLISVLFLYLADVLQPSYPSLDWRPIKVFVISLPLLAYLLLGMSLSFQLPSLRFNPVLAPLADFVIFVQDALGLEYGFESSVGLALALIIFSLPTTIVDYYYTRNARQVEGGVTSFLRDLVEIRKTGLSPERCVIDLSKRNYGALTPILQEMARRLGWGFTFQKIYEVFRNKVRSWLARVNIYLLYEATEVGGGSPETLESLAYFSEAMESLEKEKQMIITPLLIVPYIGGVVLTFSTLLLLTFSRSMLQIVGASVAIVPLINLFVPPLMIHAFLSGLVAGKISGGRVTNGFKHAILLLIMTLIAAYLSPLISQSLQI